MGATEIWERCEPATNWHPYIAKKNAGGVPLDSLRVVPAGDSLTIQGERMAGALVVPVMQPDGMLSSLQFITPPETAARLKAKGKPDKLNLPGHAVQGWFTAGELVPGASTYIVEGIGQAWACWKATGAAAVVSFGSGNMGKVASALRERDPTARLVVVPDVGKEKQAAEIAADVSGMVAAMPEGWEKNCDVHDLAQREGFDVLETLLINAFKPPKPDPRYKLLNSAGSANAVRKAKLPQGKNQTIVYKALSQLFKSGITGKAEAPPLSPCIELEAAISAGASHMTCETHRRATRAREAITGLVAGGVLGLNDGWLWVAN
jgi:hypothetical protein